jgi:RNA polymerase sigma factor (sigma-70 family)
MVDKADTHDRRALVETALTEIHRDLYRFLVRRLGDEHDAADVLQNFFVRVLSRFDDLRDEDKLRAWMASVLRSAIADHYRSKSRQSRFEGVYQVDAALGLGIVEEDVDLMICACLYKLLPTLKNDYAQLVWRTDLIGEPRSEIAADLGLNENAFRVKLHRARAALRKRLEQTCETCPEHGFLSCACPSAKSTRARLSAIRSSHGGDNG